MRAAEERPVVTPEEYIVLERAAEFRHELIDGAIVDKPGSNVWHCTINGNTAVALHRQFADAPFEVYMNQMRVRVVATDAFFYPDVVVAGGDIRFQDDEQDTLLTPVVLAEVVSPATRLHDRGVKAFHYLQIPSLQHMLLIDQQRPLVEVYSRQTDGWLLKQVEGLEGVAELPAISCHLALRDVYEDVEFPSHPAQPADHGSQ